MRLNGGNVWTQPWADMAGKRAAVNAAQSASPETHAKELVQAEQRLCEPQDRQDPHFLAVGEDRIGDHAEAVQPCPSAGMAVEKRGPAVTTMQASRRTATSVPKPARLLR
jgi:hypothetical protein